MHSIKKIIIGVLASVLVIYIFVSQSSLSRSQNNSQNQNILLTQKPEPETGTDISNLEESLDLSNLFDNNSSTEAKIDLEGPMRCFYKDDKYNIKVFIKSQNISLSKVENGQTDNFILKEGDLYEWQSGEKEGGKIAGFGQYLDFFGSISSIFSPEMIFSTVFGNYGDDYEDINIDKFKESCVKENVDESRFNLPEGVKFIEQENKS